MFALIFVETLSRRGELLRIRIKVYSQSKTDERTNLKQGWRCEGERDVKYCFKYFVLKEGV